MKKLLGIVVLGLLLSGWALVKDKLHGDLRFSVILVNLKSSALASGLLETKINNKLRTKIPKSFFIVDKELLLALDRKQY